LKYFTRWPAKVGFQSKETQTLPRYYKKLVRNLLYKARTLCKCLTSCCNCMAQYRPDL